MGLSGEFGIDMAPIAAFPVLNCAALDSGICLLSLYAPPHYVLPFSADSLQCWPEP
ncbi:exported protein [Erwinia amylovora MR1]|nr:exported protein [Erwinia amylovora MR1]